MAEFIELSSDERLEALVQAANVSGRPPHLLEKDVWVVWSLRHLFAAPYAPHLVFKVALPFRRPTVSFSVSLRTWT